MTNRIRARIVTLVAAGALVVGPASVATAAPNTANQSGGAAGVVAAVVQVDRTLNNLDLDVLSENDNVEIITVKDSLNNVLQNARFLNNITVLQDFLNNNDVDVLNDALNDNNVTVSDVVAIDVLSGGDIRLYVME